MFSKNWMLLFIEKVTMGTKRFALVFIKLTPVMLSSSFDNTQFDHLK